VIRINVSGMHILDLLLHFVIQHRRQFITFGREGWRHRTCETPPTNTSLNIDSVVLSIYVDYVFPILEVRTKSSTRNTMSPNMLLRHGRLCCHLLPLVVALKLTPSYCFHPIT